MLHNKIYIPKEWFYFSKVLSNYDILNIILDDINEVTNDLGIVILPFGFIILELLFWETGNIYSIFFQTFYYFFISILFIIVLPLGYHIKIIINISKLLMFNKIVFLKENNIIFWWKVQKNLNNNYKYTYQNIFKNLKIKYYYLDDNNDSYKFLDFLRDIKKRIIKIELPKNILKKIFTIIYYYISIVTKIIIFIYFSFLSIIIIFIWNIIFNATKNLFFIENIFEKIDKNLKILEEENKFFHKNIENFTNYSKHIKIIWNSSKNIFYLSEKLDKKLKKRKIENQIKKKLSDILKETLKDIFDKINDILLKNISDSENILKQISWNKNYLLQEKRIILWLNYLKIEQKQIQNYLNKLKTWEQKL